MQTGVIPWNTPLVTYFLGVHACMKALVYAEKIQVTHGIFNGIPLESVA